MIRVASRGKSKITIRMAARFKKLDKSIKTAAGGPAVALAYYLVAVGVRYVGCMPTYVDAEYAGVPVAQFLLYALTLSALMLTVFAMLAGFRIYRQSVRARANAGRKAARWGLIGIASGAVAFATIAAGAASMLAVSCP